MITKSKFIKGLYFVEVSNKATRFEQCRHNNEFYIGTYSGQDNFHDEVGDYDMKQCLFLTKLATEEDWKELRKLIDIQTEKADKFICESLLYKQEGLDNEKNYLIIKEDG